MARRRLLVALLVIGATVIGGGLFLRHRVQTIWADLRTAAALDLPSGYTITSRDEQGTAVCFVTCGGEGEATILITVEGPPGANLYSDLAVSLAKAHPKLSTTPSAGWVGCLFGDLPGGGYLQVMPNNCATVHGGPCAQVRLSSGID